MPVQINPDSRTGYRGWHRLLVTALILTLVYGCSPAKESPPPASSPRVRVVKPLAQEVTEWDEYPGHLEAVEQVEVRARVEGYLEKIHFRAGQQVERGDLLFVIDPRPFRIRLKQAEAELAQTQARLELARSNLARAERLLEKQFITQQDYDTKRAELLQAQAQVQAAEAQVDAARLDLSFTEIRAPITGQVGREQVTVGNLIKGGGADATVLTFIVSTDPIYAYFDVDERAALRYQHLGRPNLPVQLGLTDEQGFPHAGYLDYASPRLDTATGTRTLRGVFANPDNRLQPGLFSRIRIPAGKPYLALLLPERAIVTNLAQKSVWVMDEHHRVALRPVTVGPLIEGNRVIRQGLGPGEWVVVEGITKLKPGITVVPEKQTG